MINDNDIGKDQEDFTYVKHAHIFSHLIRNTFTVKNNYAFNNKKRVNKVTQ